jgi:hypothetical protein
MKKSVVLFAIAMFLIFACGLALTQEKSQVKVKGSQVVSGVVVVDILKGAKSLRLQCNEGAPNCSAPKVGDYTMVELPENHGMYDCKNAEIYRGDKDESKDPELVGAYCLIEK